MEGRAGPKGETVGTRATGFGLTVDSCCLLDRKCTKGMYLLEVRRGAAAYWRLGFPPTAAHVRGAFTAHLFEASCIPNLDRQMWHCLLIV